MNSVNIARRPDRAGMSSIFLGVLPASREVQIKPDVECITLPNRVTDKPLWTAGAGVGPEAHAALAHRITADEEGTDQRGRGRIFAGCDLISSFVQPRRSQRERDA